MAITILNSIEGFIFTNMDLSNIQIPGAILTNGIFHKTNFFGANLENVDFRNSYLYDANFEQCQLNGVNFGPDSFIGHTAWVRDLAFS